MVVLFAWKQFLERCQSGLICSLGKRVYGNVPRVRIPLSPPNLLVIIIKNC
ncbi:hypothetical protein BAZSYMA_ACONTIG04706_0 [Bathymodiolus azoricus thioautotrophic gill symbiont]|uniref:Uncharacterized protein n=1 Tax=Bathymodiolus azoricus thioautotrophic gill symbiont TaxID=235205 RepID=A0A1H6L334_9GAMM|nr:hypothetical protein BAZSYMA_ACONTIG04706_0 [Bathymodiolus azoricus thioautotrophic gill symbiont]